jgi:crotonobetainyl-CoA:carnitine CoA-transferase CaiB-like acyl-CoA transferase
MEMRQALDGYRVLDLSRLLPGPYCSMMLADLGADVIKIEEIKGDPTRTSPPRLDGKSYSFEQVNRNKKSIALNLKSPEGRNVFLRLAAKADVILEQFRPGVVARLGVDYETISATSPQIVYCSLTGFGQNGPHRDRSGHDLNYLALSGVLGLTTDQNGRPVIPGVQVADLAGGMIAAFGILAALVARRSTGRGQYVDVGMYDVMMAMLPVPAAHHLGGIEIGVGGKYVLSGAYPFYNVYETADGQFMTLGALEPKFWAGFCRRIGREDLIPRQFEEGADREALFAEMKQIFKSHTREEWIEMMRDADACCEPVLSLEEAFSHPQARARAMVQIGAGPDSVFKQLGFAAKLSETPARLSSPAPALGQHTDEILSELGLSRAEREAVYESGAALASDTGI